MGTLEIAIAIGAGGICLLWLVGAFFGLLTLVRVRQLASITVRPPSPWPRVSMIVPARDERASIEAATRAKLRSDYPGLEIVLVDDRSTDGTGEIVDRLAHEDGRVRAVHVTSLPQGWLGKVHALDCGVRVATGAWLLFIDADVHLAPDALSRAIAWGEEHRLDHVVVLPEIAHGGFLLDAAYSAFGRYFAISQRLWRAGKPGASVSVGVGAFNLVRREAFERTPGFEWLRRDVVDDFGLGLMLANARARAGVIAGRGLVRLAWYESFRELARGLEKNLFVILGCSPWRAVRAALTILAIEVAPVVAVIAPGESGVLRALGISALSAGLVSSIAGARWAGRRVLPAALLPLGSMLLAAVMVRAGALGWWRGGIFWRGTFHASQDLRDGSRLPWLQPRRARLAGEGDSR